MNGSPSNLPANQCKWGQRLIWFPMLPSYQWNFAVRTMPCPSEPGGRYGVADLTPFILRLEVGAVRLCRCVRFPNMRQAMERIEYGQSQPHTPGHFVG